LTTPQFFNRKFVFRTFFLWSFEFVSNGSLRVAPSGFWVSSLSSLPHFLLMSTEKVDSIFYWVWLLGGGQQESISDAMRLKNDPSFPPDQFFYLCIGLPCILCLWEESKNGWAAPCH